jgi:hypothetical protein
MTLHILWRFPGCLLLLTLLGCATFQGGNKIMDTKLDESFRHDFKEYKLEPASIKQTSVDRTFPQVNFDEVWEASLVVLMQSGIIVKADKNAGVILCITTPPAALYVERGESPRVYVRVAEELFEYESYHRIKSVINPAVVITGKAQESDVMDKVQERGNAYRPTVAERDAVTTKLLDMLAAQLYAGKKWKYLTGS